MLVWAGGAAAQTAHDRHVLFERSLTDTAYYFSDVTVIIPSAVDAAGGRLPVETQRVFTPPNALRLTWTSRPGGTCKAMIRRERWRNQNTSFDGDTLVFRPYTDEPIPNAHWAHLEAFHGQS